MFQLFSVFSSVITSLLSLFKPVLIVLLKLIVIGLLPFLTACTVYFSYYYIKGYRPLKCHLGKFKGHNILYKLFVQLPNRIILDYYTKDPDIFKEYGFYMVVGKQGTGKSVTMAYLLHKWQTIYPKLKVISNMGYRYEDTKLVDLSQLSLNTNGIYGEVDVLDEVQSVLGTEFSKNFPEYFKELIHQQRKVRRCILGGTQDFEQVAKAIRLQCRYVFMVKTYFNCFTVVKQYDCVLDKDAKLITGVSNKPIKTFCFVHDDFLRNSFDSYKTVDKIKVK